MPSKLWSDTSLRELGRTLRPLTSGDPSGLRRTLRGGVPKHEGRGPRQFPRIVEVDLTADLCGAAPTVSASGELLPSRQAIDISSDTLANPMNRRAQSGDTIWMIETDTNPQTWDVFEVPRRKVTNMIGIEHTTNCLRAWGLEQAGEWCSDDENVDANEVINYVDCDGNDIGACSSTITFDANFFATT